MTMTVKLPVALEQSLRQASADLGMPASELIREALQAYLSSAVVELPSAYELGRDLFGAHQGPADLARRRKTLAADVWSDKHGRRTTRR